MFFNRPHRRPPSWLRRLRSLVIIGAATVAGIALLATSASANGLPIQGETAFVTGLNGAAVRSFTKFTLKPTGDGFDGTFATPVVIPYEVLDNKLILGVGLPFVVGAKTSTRNITPKYGLGGLKLFGKINLFQLDGRGETLRVAGKLGLNLPTDLGTFVGNLGGLPAPAVAGPRVPEVAASLIVTKLIGRFGANADVGYIVRPPLGEVDPGDTIFYNGSIAMRAWPWVFKTYPDHQVNVILEANGQATGLEKLATDLTANTGGNILFLSPGLQYLYGTFLVETSVQVSVPYVTFGQTILNIPTVTALAGIRWLIF